MLATGQVDVLADISDEQLAEASLDDEHLQMLREIGLRHAVTVPLVARGRTLGALSFIIAESGRRFSEGDIAMFVELGRRAGVTIENARLYTERSRIAHTLQARLLPSRLPAPPGVRPPARSPAPRAGPYTERG